MVAGHTLVPDFGQLTVLDSARDVVELQSLWAEKTAVLVFLRHFG